jgi:hypothetical protein
MINWKGCGRKRQWPILTHYPYIYIYLEELETIKNLMKIAIVKLTTHLHLVQRLRMRGDIPSLLQYAFMMWCSVKAQRIAVHRDDI